MKKIIALSFVAAASFGLAACSEKPAAESTEVNAVETNATAEAAVADINATTENALDTANTALNEAAANDVGVANGVAAEATNNAM